MTSSTPLFQLIKSLSKSEKRSFKLFANRNTVTDKNNYIILFEAIDRQKTYNDVDLQKYLKGKIKLNALSTIKVQLYNLILRSLRQYHSKRNPAYIIRMYMEHFDILFEKGFYSQCKKVLNKAYDLAFKYEMFDVIDTLSIHEYKLVMKKSNYEDIEEFVTNTYPKIKAIRKLNEIAAEFEYLQAKIKLLVLKSNRSGLNMDKHKFEEIIHHPLLQQGPESLTHFNQIDYHIIWGYYHTIMGNRDKAYYFRKKVLDLMEIKGEIILYNPNVWIFNARLLLITLGTFRMYEEFNNEEARIKSLINDISNTKKSQTLKSEIYVTIYNCRLDFEIDRGFFKSSSSYAKEAEEEFHLYTNQIDINSKMVIYFNFSYAYFGNGEYHLALKWINHLLNENYGNARMDLQCMSKLMNIAIHYELGNYDIIPSLISRANNFLIKMDRKFKYETSFLNFAKKHLMFKYSSDLKDAFQKEISDLELIIEDPAEKLTNECFDFINWLKTKIENKSMEEVIRNASKSGSTYKGIL